MRSRLALVIIVGGAAGIAAACGGGDDPPPPYSSPNATGGTSGHGHGGSQSGAAGESGAGGVSTGGQSGESATIGSAGSLVLGTAGVPYTGDMGVGAGTGGGGGAPGPGDGSGHLFIGPGGYDGAQGTRDDPLGTLAGAAALATHGDTIVFLAGNYSFPALDDAIVIPDGVDITADVARLVVLAGSGGTLLDLAGDTHVDGLRFTGFATVANVASVDGNVTVTNASFSACPSEDGKRVFEVGGGATVTLTGDSMHDWGDCPTFAQVTESGSFALDGGIIHFSGNAEPAVFSADASSKLVLSNLRAIDGDRTLLALADDSETTVSASTFDSSANNAIVLGDRASLDVTNSELSLGAAPLPDACILSNLDGPSTLTLADSLIHGCRAGLSGAAPATLIITHTDFYGMTESGLDLTTADGSVIDLEAASFYADALRAARFGGGNPSVFHLTVRGTSVATVPTGFDLAGDAGSTWDFGTLAKPGANSFNADMTSLLLSSASIATVTAIGNAWAPNVQGADSGGHYVAAGAGGVLEVTSGSGQNYDDTVGATLRLAENP